MLLKENPNFPLKIIIQILSMTTAPVTLTHISLDKNPAPFLDPLHFHFTFQTQRPLNAPLQWRIIYVGSASDQKHDQLLEEFEVEAAQVGQPMQCKVDCRAPDWKKIPRRELLSLTAIIITVSYRHREFLRIGYYVHIMPAPSLTQQDKNKAPAEQIVPHLTRTVLIDKPRITKFDIVWESEEKEPKNEANNDSPCKGEKETSNSALSISKTSCNQKEESDQVLSCMMKQKKEKKIRKSAARRVL